VRGGAGVGAVAAHRAPLPAQLLAEPDFLLARNLNLIERLWKFVKQQCLASRPLPDYATFTHTIDACLNTLGSTHKERMTTLLTLNFQTYQDEPVLSE
jgi:hypothetical protein